MEAVIERQQRVASKRDERRLPGLGQDGGPRLLRPGLAVLDGLTLAPLRHRLGVRRENDSPDRFLILLTFGWAKSVGGVAQTVYRGVERVRSRFILTMAANNLARLPRLLAA